MSKFVRMRRAYTHPQEDGTRRTIPAGWSGNLDDEIAAAAEAGGYTHPDRRQPRRAAAAGDADEDRELEKMHRDDLDTIATGRGMDPKQYRTKDDLIAALRG